MKKIRHFLNLEDITKQDLEKIIEESKKFKKDKNYLDTLLYKKKIGLVFTKHSTRTRASFEVGIKEMQGETVFFSNNESQFSRGESFIDTFKVLERYFDALVIRNDDYASLEEFSTEAKIPIINALTNYNHPCQAIADYFTILEHKQKVENLKITFLGEGNNVAISLILLAVKLELDLTLGIPPRQGNPFFFDLLKKYPQIKITDKPEEAIKASDVVYTDTWNSMGEQKKNQEIFQPFQVNAQLTKLAKEDFIFLHCLPAYRGQEVSSEIIDGPNSVVFDQAENRLFTQKAILAHLLG